MILAAGLAEYYALRSRFAAEERVPRPLDRTASNYADFDTPSFAHKHCAELGPGLTRVELYLESVHCAACLWLVEKLPTLLAGVRSARLDLARKVLTLDWEPQRIALSDVARHLDRLGYPARPYTDLVVQAARRSEERRLLMRLGVAGAIAGNVMLLSFALYSGAFEGMAPEFERFFETITLLLVVPSVTYCAAEFYRGAWGSLRARTPHMDLPVSVGILAAALWGAVNVVRGSGDLYFDTVTTLVFLLLSGRYLELRQQNAARNAMERAESLTPGRARKLGVAGDYAEVPVEDVRPGDLVEVLCGETLPVDGIVRSGVSELDTRVLTGESLPVSVGPGSQAFAGSTNLTGRLCLVSGSSGSDTRVARLMREVERARRARPRVLRLVDRLAGVFVVTVLLLAALTFAIWLRGGIEQAVEHATALLIVACPCALGMATPLAVSSTLARAAQHRILIKGGDVLERLCEPALIIFDKTGTLTSGKLRLCAWAGARSARPLLLALEAHSAHPIARAVCRALSAEAAPELEDLTEVPGGGVHARLGERSVAAGSPAWVLRLGVEMPGWARRAVARQTTKGRTPVALLDGASVTALAFFEDQVVPGAARTLGELRRLGHRLVLLSGDHPSVTRQVAHELGRAAGVANLFEEVLGAASPEDKAAYVRKHKAKGRTIVVGDGVNDAAALAEADVGVAVKGGAEASLLAADVFLGGEGVEQLPSLFAGARLTLSTIRRGIVISLVYNVLGVGLAISGTLSPLIAAILMPFSSLSVVKGAYGSKSFRGVK
jgi:Cu2+-exporting ATPase